MMIALPRLFLILAVSICLTAFPVIAANWDKAQKKHCTAIGLREYHARILNTGDWEKDCRNTQITIAGKRFSKPRDCRWPPFNGVWGVWHVPDKSCYGTWLPVKDDGCVSPGRRQFAARLSDDKGMGWGAACKGSPIPHKGGRFAGQRRCDNHGVGGMFAVWTEEDNLCKPHFAEVKKEGCVGKARRRHTARLLESSNWRRDCAAATISVNGTAPRKPDWCETYPLEGEFGVWIEADEAGCPGTEEEITRERKAQDQARIDAIAVSMSSNMKALEAGQIHCEPNWVQDIVNFFAGPQGKQRYCAMRAALDDDPKINAVTLGATVNGGLGFSFASTVGYAMERGPRCRKFATNALSIGIAMGVSGGMEMGYWETDLAGVEGVTNGMQGNISALVGGGVGAHWTNPDGKLGITRSFGVNPGLDIGVEYVHSWTWFIGDEIPCEEMNWG